MKAEYTLVFLTLFVRLGTGLILVHLLASLWTPLLPDPIVALIALVVTGLGLGLSLLHLGKPGRLLNSFNNRKSMVTWEAIISVPLMAALTALAYFSYQAPGSTGVLAAKLATAVLSVAFIFITANVYYLRARPAWTTPLVLYEYFVSTACLGVLGFGAVAVFLQRMTVQIASVLALVLLPLLIAEAIITYAYRARAIRVNPTAAKALLAKPTRGIYRWFVAVGVLLPIACVAVSLLGREVAVNMLVALASYSVGAICWRVLFFNSATVIKITPDIVG